MRKGGKGKEEKAVKLASQGIPKTTHGRAASLLRTGTQEPLQGEAGDRYEQRESLFSEHSVLGSMPGSSQTVSHLIVSTL